MNKHSIDQLLEACGAPAQLQVTVAGPGHAEALGKRLFLPLALIGRESNADLSLPDAAVSRRHAYVQVVNGRLFGMDLRSRSGMTWAAAHDGVGWIEWNDIVQIGPFCLSFEIAGAERANRSESSPNPLEVESLGTGAEPALTLRCHMGPGDPFDWQMPSVLALVGRRAGRWGLSLPDADLSSFHCTLLRTPIGAWIIDLLGQGGSLLNGRRVRWGRLDDGDELQIGRYRFTVSLRAVEDGRPSLRAARVSENGAGRVNHSGEQTSLTRNDQPAASASSTPTGGGSLVAVDAPPRTELTEAVMTSLFNQFATMQNQMFDQFQQAITMMVEMFSDMQREQVGLIRQEVDRLHQITAEIQTLQAEAARTTPPRRNDREAPAGAASPLDSQDFEEALTEMDVSEDRSAPRDAPREAADREDAESATSSGPPAEGDGEVHVWLYDKIAELQRERQSRLQRIIGFLRGK